MSNLTSLFSEKAKRSGLKGVLADSLTVMFADTRHGMDGKTKEAFNRVKERANGDARVAGYVAKIELSIGRHVPHAATHALHKM